MNQSMYKAIYIPSSCFTEAWEKAKKKCINLFGEEAFEDYGGFDGWAEETLEYFLVDFLATFNIYECEDEDEDEGEF